MTEGVFFTKGINSKYIDSEFCDSGQLIQHSPEDCKLSIKKGFEHKGVSTEEFLPLTEEYYKNFLKFNYPKNWAVSRDENYKVVHINKSVDNSLKPYAEISYGRYTSKLGLPGENVLEHGKKDSMIKDIQQKKIGNYNFIIYKKEGEGFEEIKYETKIKGRYFLMVTVFFTGYENYEEDMERVLETIKMKENKNNITVDAYEDDVLSLDLKRNTFSLIQILSQQEAKINEQRASYELVDNVNAQKLARGTIYPYGDVEPIDDMYKKAITSHKNRLLNFPEQAERLKNTSHEKVKIGSYVYIKETNPIFVDYTTFVNGYSVSWFFNDNKSFVKTFEDVLATVKYKL